jgi:hypothetical protein
MTRRRPESRVSVSTEPTSSDVARRAYELYEARGSEPGADLDEWFRAEREWREPAARRGLSAASRPERRCR